MWSKKTLLWICVAVVLVAVVAGVLFFIQRPRNQAAIAVDGTITVTTRQDGTFCVSWPAETDVQYYTLQVLNEAGEDLYSCSTGAVCSAVLPEMPMDETLLIRVTAIGGVDERDSVADRVLEHQVQLTSPRIGQLQWVADGASKTVQVTFDMSEGQLCRMYVAKGNGEPEPVAELTEGTTVLDFGENGRFTIPTQDMPLHVSFQLENNEGRVCYVGQAVDGFTITKECFLDDVLTTTCTDHGDNSYTLTWNETRGEQYEVRLSGDGGQSWQTLATISTDQERSYTTKQLGAFGDYQLWVVAVGGQTLPDSEFAAYSEPVQVTTGAQLLYSTIWPLMDRSVYSDTTASKILGTAPAGSAWCVLGMEGKYLKIRFDGCDGYIDSDYCLINLPEYVGRLCNYNITNSHYCAFLIHEYGIDNVSGTVLTGYENVRTGEGTYLVPLLFPTAQKLIKAGQVAREQGYTLTIYDSFRPKNATDMVYRVTSGVLDQAVPTQTFSGKQVTDLDLVSWRSDGSMAMTYRVLMTNGGQYNLGAFLAPGNSRHNFGVALDLTLMDNSTRQELPMQSSIHDLSWYSATKRNNENANILREIMMGAGFKDLQSEWWHFQDQTIYDQHTYEPLRTGVSWCCWVSDGIGWRYRLDDGSFYTNCTETIDGKTYTFDANGYTNY